MDASYFSSLLFFVVELYSLEWICHSFVHHSPVDGLELFPLLGSSEQSCCQQLIQISEWTYAFTCLCRDAMEKLPTVFQSILAIQISKYPSSGV